MSSRPPSDPSESASRPSRNVPKPPPFRANEHPTVSTKPGSSADSGVPSNGINFASDSTTAAKHSNRRFRSTILAERERPSRWRTLLRAIGPRWSGTGLGLSAPPWLLSLLMHILILLLLALWLLPKDHRNQIDLDAVFFDSRGEQMEAQPIDVGPPIEPDPEPIKADEPLAEVEEPIVSPPNEAVVPESPLAGFESVVPNVGSALTGREPGQRQSLLRAFGGTAETEAAVRKGLEWLATQQQSDGRWSLRGPYADGSQNENHTAATAMALLAFQGAGHTHQAGPYRAVVRRGIRALLKMQDESGSFFTGKIGHHRLYSQGQAMIAVCELHAMTKNDRQLENAAQLAVDYAVRIQDRYGGWRYEPGFDSDTSVSGWFMMGLQSARMAGLEVPNEVLDNLSAYLDRAADSSGARYSYQPAMDPTYSMTAEGLLCRQYLGWRRDDPRLLEGVSIISQRPIAWDDRDVYYWYYATQVLHHFGGEPWREWNEELRSVLPAEQSVDGKEAGSWSSLGDKWGAQGGRLYVTCMSLYMLEVYYRHLPLYHAATRAAK